MHKTKWTFIHIYNYNILKPLFKYRKKEPKHKCWMQRLLKNDATDAKTTMQSETIGIQKKYQHTYTFAHKTSAKNHHVIILHTRPGTHRCEYQITGLTPPVSPTHIHSSFLFENTASERRHWGAAAISSCNRQWVCWSLLPNVHMTRELPRLIHVRCPHYKHFCTCREFVFAHIGIIERKRASQEEENLENEQKYREENFFKGNHTEFVIMQKTNEDTKNNAICST